MTLIFTKVTEIFLESLYTGGWAISHYPEASVVTVVAIDVLCIPEYTAQNHWGYLVIHIATAPTVLYGKG